MKNIYWTISSFIPAWSSTTSFSFFRSFTHFGMCACVNVHHEVCKTEKVPWKNGKTHSHMCHGLEREKNVWNGKTDDAIAKQRNRLQLVRKRKWWTQPNNRKTWMECSNREWMHAATRESDTVHSNKTAINILKQSQEADKQFFPFFSAQVSAIHSRGVICYGLFCCCCCFFFFFMLLFTFSLLFFWIWCECVCVCISSIQMTRRRCRNFAQTLTHSHHIHVHLWMYTFPHSISFSFRFVLVFGVCGWWLRYHFFWTL